MRKSKTELGSVQFPPNERREGRSESKGLIRIKSGPQEAARKGNRRRAKRLKTLSSVWLVFLGLTYKPQHSGETELAGEAVRGTQSHAPRFFSFFFFFFFF